jgi:hypothetical protein
METKMFVLSNLNTLTSIYVISTYKRITNKFSFTKTYAKTTNYFIMAYTKKTIDYKED